MNIKILEQKQEPLLSRTEVKAELSFEGATPSNEELKKALATQLKADENLVVIKSIYTEFGIAKATATAYIYTDKKALESIEPKPKEKKGKKAEKPKPAPKEEAPKEEKPVEEKKEEAPKEEKPAE